MARTMFKRRPRDNTIMEEQKRRLEEQKRRLEERCELSKRILVNLALKHFNENNNEEDTEYEPVRGVGFGAFQDRVQNCFVWFKHINFLAKPKGAPDSEVKLFFAEIKSAFSVGDLVISCGILGPEGVVTGVSGCRACLNEGKAIVQHPVDGEFTRGQYPPTVLEVHP